MSKVQHSVKLVSYNSTDLDRVSYSTGDVVFDSTNTTLRVMDGVNQGGFQLLRADLSNAQGALGVTISNDPPASPKTGSLWFNSSNGALYIYYTDSDGSQWIQPVAAPGQVTQSGSYTLLAATRYVLGGAIADGTTILVSPTGVISIPTANSYVNPSFLGSTTIQNITDQVTSFSQTLPSSGGVIDYDWSQNSAVFLQTGVNANYTANFTNLPTTNNRLYSVSIIINQSPAAGYYPQAVQIDGTPYTLNWSNGTAPVPGTSETDKFIFILLRSNNTWNVSAYYELDRTAGAVDDSLYSLPFASTTQLGGVIADATSIAVSNGVISLVATPRSSASLLAGITTIQHITYPLTTVTGGDGVTYTVTNSGSSAYIINGNSDPSINLIRGNTYYFSVNATGHPFFIKTSRTTGTGNTYSSGVTNNGAQVGTVTFTVPLDAPSTLYYICQYHSDMAGEFIISNSASVIAYDWTSGTSVYYQTGVTANFTANFSNMPTTNNRLYVISIAIAQGSTGYYPNAVQINGVSQTLNWNSAVTPITPGTNEKDLFTFTLLRANNAWSVSGNILTNGV